MKHPPRITASVSSSSGFGRAACPATGQYSLWLKDDAPSTELRRWFGHDPDKWDEFRQRYHKELKKNNDLIKLLKSKAKAGTITLIYAAQDEEHNGALVLKRFLHRPG